MTPTPRSGALTDMEKWSRGLILDDYRSFGEYYSPSERLSLKAGSSPLHAAVQLASNCVELHVRKLRWSSPTYWSLVEQINKLIKEKNLLLNESPRCTSAVCMKDEVVPRRLCRSA